MASIWSRKRDLAYLAFFMTHLPIVYLIDTAPLQPAIVRTDFSQQLRDFYVATYHDKFFSEPIPVWFNVFIWLEVLYHVPLSLWAIRGLLRDHPMVPVHLLVFGVEALITSLTCLVVVWSWPDRSVAQKQQLTTLYGPYVALGALMALDMTCRLRDRLMPKAKRE
ncbi:hypothetical protein NUU61_009595 [Penicillium alfredii]|uniref:Efficient mitochondria targeting-associated protein 19 n=1 Tax=Penicillium alfredii TaxID=1506179 RepID=A0A9W9JTS4_9EURO|nr:uncharacterized protein NUU61_009595 [Penicillium alfredii]KAJ5081331.1 hypothetical protein NUU61_009595 [Penicillium alfredii]